LGIIGSFVEENLIFFDSIIVFLYLQRKKINMIRVSIKENEDINRALKRFKKKFEKAQVIKEYRNNAFYTKKSVSLREEKLRASYVQRLRSKEA
tara:strand:- start:135 stop:416 length:282 start_codon:yes stop_codon:yes gene_type:complete